MATSDFLIAEFQESPIPEGSPRFVGMPATAGKPGVVIGMRRVGKTYLMYQRMRELIASGVDKRDLLYVNFEDDRLQPAADGLLDALLEAFYRSNPEARRRRAYLFLDEIQVIPEWPRFVRRVLDTEQVEIMVSGSSAKLLHTEVATELRGRGIAVEVFPYSFAESAVAAGVPMPPRLPPGPKARSRLEAHLHQHLTVGGFPEVQAMPLAERIQTLQDYVELVLLRDVIERHRIENATATRAFARLLLQSPAHTFSVNKAHGDLRSRGLAVSKDLLHALLDHFQDAYLVFAIPVFKKSLRAQATNPRKLYAIDPGLAAAMSHVTATDVGARLENAVFLELRRRHGRLLQGQVSYYLTASGHEVDFVVGDLFEQRAGRLVQACASLAEPATRAREVRALAEAMAETGLRTAEIVTLHEEETITTDAGAIAVVPAWRWLLDDGTRG
ncbi:MAG TPA: ATP-binding protein [Thermoleophilia bacterium]